jgi:hypothetical protein
MLIYNNSYKFFANAIMHNLKQIQNRRTLLKVLCNEGAFVRLR